MINLSKGGQRISLEKAAQEAGVAVPKVVGVGLGWKTNKYDGGGEFDLDASAFMLGANEKVLSDNDFIFYGTAADVMAASPVKTAGDNRTGNDGSGDAETITVDLAGISASHEKIDFTVTIYDAEKRNQTFGMVEDAYVRVYDAETGVGLIRYDLSEDFSIETALVVAELYKHNGGWQFKAIGQGFQGGLAALCRNYGVDV